MLAEKRIEYEVVETVSRETVQTKLKIMNLKSTIRLSTLVG